MPFAVHDLHLSASTICFGWVAGGAALTDSGFLQGVSLARPPAISHYSGISTALRSPRRGIAHPEVEGKH